ncbi:MAG: acyl-[acyl carrier protein]--UDP-N-acetylglucosamine O-acyltransferase, partial [Planctomycetaceae bacterium]
MPTQISRLSDVHQLARIGDDVEIGPFCVVGP